MTGALSGQVCIPGAGPIREILACCSASAESSLVPIDPAARPPAENPAFDSRGHAAEPRSLV